MPERRVLVTGAAGLLGGEISGQLQARGFKVTGLINRNPDIFRNDGSPVAVTKTVRGDITQPRFGLGERAWQDLSEDTDLIVHCAAVTDFTAESDAHRQVNVDGTRHVIDLARAADAELLHVSTAYVSGDREGVILEAELDAGQGFTNGYESTKFKAEKLVRESGLRHAIARPSIVIGDHPEGRSRSFETIYPILKVFAEGWVTTMPATPWATLNLVPIDYVCKSIVTMAERFGEAEGQTFHIVSSKPTPLRAFPDTLGKFEGLSAPDWVPPETFDPSALRPVEKRFFQKGAEVYARYFTRSAFYDDRRHRAFSGGSCPSTDDAWWERVVAYCLKAGFIKPRKKSRAAS